MSLSFGDLPECNSWKKSILLCADTITIILSSCKTIYIEKLPGNVRNINKYKKQEYLLKVDYESVSSMKKESIIQKYNKFYVSKMDSLYKGLLKHYSVQLADTFSSKLESIDNIYDKIQ